MFINNNLVNDIDIDGRNSGAPDQGTGEGNNCPGNSFPAHPVLPPPAQGCGPGNINERVKDGPEKEEDCEKSDHCPGKWMCQYYKKCIEISLTACPGRTRTQTTYDWWPDGKTCGECR